MPRALAMVAWCLLVLAGVYILAYRTDRGASSGTVAKRVLPKNTLLLAQDIQQPVFVNRYVVSAKAVPKGATLNAEDVADEPTLPDIVPGTVLLSVAVLLADVANGVNAESKVKLCGKGSLQYSEVIVLAVRCPTGSKEGNCSAIIQLPAEAAADVATKGLKDKASASELRLAARCQ